MAGETPLFGADVRAAEMPAAEKRRGFFLPAAVGSLFSRPRAAPRPLFSGEGLASLYSVGASSDRDVSFGFLLRQSAAAIDRGRTLIDARGAEIARVVAARGLSEASLAASGARLFIALFWVFIGVVLAREAGFGLPVRGLDAASAAMLARVFVAAGFVGAVAAFVGGFLVRAGEKNVSGDFAFGADAGAIAREFGETVAELKARIDEGEGSAGDLSRLHLAAVEAAAFLDGISFLAEPDHQRAEDEFQAFLKNHAPAAGSGAGLLLLLILGAVVGAVAAAGGVPGFGYTGLPLWAVAALPGLAFLYAGLGAVFSAAGAASAGGASARARHEILVRLRRAYVEAGAPRADDLIGDAEAAIAHFGRRRGVDAPQSSHAGAAGAEDFAWRRPAEAPRFVSQSFEAAPPVFRAETQAPLRKNFFTGRRRNADPKQTASAPDAPPWLND